MIDPVFAAGWAIILGVMGIFETWALLRKKRGDTLSELVWALLSKARVLQFVAGGFLIWLLIHFVFLGQFG